MAPAWPAAVVLNGEDRLKGRKSELGSYRKSGVSGQRSGEKKVLGASSRQQQDSC